MEILLTNLRPISLFRIKFEQLLEEFLILEVRSVSLLDSVSP